MPRTKNFANEQLIAEKYRGIRPAPGYPAQPDHSEKATLFKLAGCGGQDRREAHRKLRDVAGLIGLRAFIIAHPESRYFGVGKIERDQVEDYASRKGWDIDDSRTLARAAAELQSARRERGVADTRSSCGRDKQAMSVWGKVSGAAAGLLVGGPVGALVGAVAGHFTDRSRGRSRRDLHHRGDRAGGENGARPMACQR